jgi:transposase-like protein
VKRIYSTNPLERVKREVRRRTAVVGTFPDPIAALRLVGSALSEVHDESQVGRRYLGLDSMRRMGEPGEDY